MEENLAQRLQITAETGMAPAATVDFVTEVMDALAETHVVTDASAGMMASHLIAALVRAEAGEVIAGPPDSAFQEAVTASPDVLVRAQQIADDAATRLGSQLPDDEVKFLSIHLATLDVAYRKENR